MCQLCNDAKRKHPSYVFCPYCGKNYNSNNFKPMYVNQVTVECDRHGNPYGLETITSIKIN